MDEKKLEEFIFKNVFTKGSTTYSKSSLFFSKEIYADVLAFYSFVRVIDNLVDLQPKQTEAFYFLKEIFFKGLNGNETVPPIIKKICLLIKKKSINTDYFISFFSSMESDLQQSYTIDSMEECKRYMYGSADIIGLVMSIICDISKEAWGYAAQLGSCMQYINFIRDIGEDYNKQRQYIPLSIGKSPPFKNLSQQETLQYPDEFKQFIRDNLQLYYTWLQEAHKGFRFLPHNIYVPFFTAMQGYHYVAKKIYANPFLVYEKAIKPNKYYILFCGIINMFASSSRKFSLPLS